MNVIRQGDVLLVPVSSLPKKAVVISSDEVVLAYGEVTGHSHRIAEPPKAKLWSADAERFLQVLERTALIHEEHLAPVVPPGLYRVVIQSAYTPAGLRAVED